MVYGEIAKAEIKHVVRYHGAPRMIVCDRILSACLVIWNPYKKPIGTKLLKSTFFHLKTSRWTEEKDQLNFKRYHVNCCNGLIRA